MQTKMGLHDSRYEDVIFIIIFNHFDVFMELFTSLKSCGTFVNQLNAGMAGRMMYLTSFIGCGNFVLNRTINHDI